MRDASCQVAMLLPLPFDGVEAAMLEGSKEPETTGVPADWPGVTVTPLLSFETDRIILDDFKFLLGVRYCCF